MTHVRHVLLATIFASAALGTGTVSAADLPSRAYLQAVPPTPIDPWTGFYAGVNVGGAFSDGSITTTGTPVSFNPAGVNMGAPATMNALAAVLGSSASHSNGNFIGGGQLGYNYRLQSAYIFGLEADMQGLAGSGGASSAVTSSSFGPFGFPANNYGAVGSFSQRLDYLGTVRGRVGFLATPDVLLYATGGFAYGGEHVSSSFSVQETFPGAFAAITPPIFGGASSSRTAVGSTVGGGLEWMFGAKWSARLEYLYYDLGSARASVPLTQIINNGPFVNTPWATAQARTSARFNGSIVRVGLNYHFD